MTQTSHDGNDQLELIPGEPETTTNAPTVTPAPTAPPAPAPAFSNTPIAPVSPKPVAPVPPVTPPAATATTVPSSGGSNPVDTPVIVSQRIDINGQAASSTTPATQTTTATKPVAKTSPQAQRVISIHESALPLWCRAAGSAANEMLTIARDINDGADAHRDAQPFIKDETLAVTAITTMPGKTQTVPAWQITAADTKADHILHYDSGKETYTLYRVIAE